VTSYTGGVAKLSAGIKAATAALAANPNDATALATLQAYSAQLAAVAAKGGSIAGGVSGLSSGISQSASGAATLASNGPALVSGASGLASGTTKLADGVGDLSSGLADGAAQLPSGDGVSSDAAAVAADPVTLTVTTDNGITGPGSAIATLFVPMGLWIGALAMFLVLRPASRRALASTATAGRLIASALSRAGAVAAIQAALLVALLHTAGGVSWAALPATLPFALLVAAAFTAFHYLLTIGLGRGGLVISLLLLAVQVAAVGGIFPTEMLAGPFPLLRPFMPLAWAVDGIQQLVTGGGAGIVVGSAAALLALAIGSIVVATLAIRRTRNRALRPVLAG
jgi:putative membrane protein